MRTTLTLEDDVAALLRQLRKKKDLSLKQLINAALREGLPRLFDAVSAPTPRMVTQHHDLGECLVGSLDDVSEVLAVAEGEAFK